MRTFKLILFFCIGISFFANAQDAEHPVKWKFSIEKTSKNNYTLKATAKLAAGFHIWATDPGGDGSLIPTLFEFADEEMIQWKGDWKESPEPTVQELEYVEGAIRWHENEVVFSRSFVSENPMPIDGSVNFQVCNAQSCFPPEDVDFKLQVK